MQLEVVRDYGSKKVQEYLKKNKINVKTLKDGRILYSKYIF